MRIDGTDFDSLIAEIGMPGALSWAEGCIKRAIVRREHRWIIKGFPNSGAIQLPAGKTQSVESIAYVSSGATVTLNNGPTSQTPGTDWQEELRGNQGGFLMPAQGESWPSADTDVPAPVTITFDAGWEDADIPGEILDAMVMWIGDHLDVTTALDAANGADLLVKAKKLSPWLLHRWQ